MKNLLSLLLLAGCTSPASPPTVAPARSAAEDSVALRAMMNAPLAVLPAPAGPFDGRWYRPYDDAPGLPIGLERLSISHDTLGRYLITIGPTKGAGSTEAFTAYTSGDSLHIFGNPDHHSSAMGLRLEAAGRRMVLSYSLSTGLPNELPPRIVRDTFWLDSLAGRR